MKNKDRIRSPIPHRLSKMLSLDREVLTGYAFLLPLLLFIFALILLPVLGTFLDSLQRDLPYLPNKFIGLENYLALFRDAGFWESVRFTTLFVVVSVPLEVILGLIISLLLKETFPGRTALFLSPGPFPPLFPVVFSNSSTITAMVWPTTLPSY